MIDAALLLNCTSDAVVGLDAELAFRELNDRAALLYRRQRTELLGRRMDEVFPELESTGAMAQLRTARDQARPSRFELFVPSLFSWHGVLAVPRDGGLVLFARDISERVRREDNEAARAAVRKIIESMPLCVTITRGPQHRIDQANRMARALVGHREVEGELVERILPEAREQGFIELLDGVFRSGEPYRGEEVPLRWRPHPAQDERLGYFDLIYQPLRGGSGQVEGILHLGTEVTEKVERRVLLERFASERRAVLEQLEEGVILADAHGRITFVNESAERMHGTKLLGVGPDEYSAAYSLLTDAGAPHPPEQLPLSRAVREHATVRDAVWKIRRTDGTVLRVRGSAKPVFTDSQLVGCVLTLAPHPE